MEYAGSSQLGSAKLPWLVSPLIRVVPFQNGRTPWLINGVRNHWTIHWDDPPNKSSNVLSVREFPDLIVWHGDVVFWTINPTQSGRVRGVLGYSPWNLTFYHQKFQVPKMVAPSPRTIPASPKTLVTLSTFAFLKVKIPDCHKCQVDL